MKIHGDVAPGSPRSSTRQRPDRVGAAMVRSHHTSFPLSALLLNNALYGCVRAR